MLCVKWSIVTYTRQHKYRIAIAFPALYTKRLEFYLRRFNTSNMVRFIGSSFCPSRHVPSHACIYWETRMAWNKIRPWSLEPNWTCGHKIVCNHYINLAICGVIQISLIFYIIVRSTSPIKNYVSAVIKFHVTNSEKKKKIFSTQILNLTIANMSGIFQEQDCIRRKMVFEASFLLCCLENYND